MSREQIVAEQAYVPSPGDRLHVWPGARLPGIEPRRALALTGPVPFGGTTCVRVEYLSGRRVGGTDYLALTHVEPVPDVREQVARAIAEAADDGVFDRDDPDCTSDDEDRAYWLRLADAALAASAALPEERSRMQEQFDAARKRSESLPPHARPVLTRPTAKPSQAGTEGGRYE